MSLLGIYNHLDAAKESVTSGIKTIEVDHANVHSGDGYSLVPTTATASLAVETTYSRFIVMRQTSDVSDVIHLKENIFITDGYDVKFELWEGVLSPGIYSGTITIAATTCELNAGDFAIAVDSDSVAVTVTTGQSLADIVSTAATALDTGITGCNATFASSVITVSRTSDKNYVAMTLTHTASCTGVEGTVVTAMSTNELTEYDVFNRNRNSADTSPLIIGVTSSSVTAATLWQTGTQILERFWIHGSSCYGVGQNVLGSHGGSVNLNVEWMLKSTTNYAWAIINDGTSCFVIPWFYWYEEAS